MSRKIINTESLQSAFPTVKSTFLDRNRNLMEQQLFCMLMQERLTAQPPPTSLFWSPGLCWPSVFWAVGQHKSQVSPTALFILSPCLLCTPCRARHNATLRKYLNLVLFQLFCKWEIGKKKKREARDTSRAPNLQRAERRAAVTVVSQLTVVSPQIVRTNVTLQKTEKRNHPEGIYVKWLS